MKNFDLTYLSRSRYTKKVDYWVHAMTTLEYRKRQEQ